MKLILESTDQGLGHKLYANTVFDYAVAERLVVRPQKGTQRVNQRGASDFICETVVERGDKGGEVDKGLLK